MENEKCHELMFMRLASKQTLRSSLLFALHRARFEPVSVEASMMDGYEQYDTMS